MSSFTYSVYIPRLDKDIQDANTLITSKFQEENLGNASRIDILKVFNEKGVWVYNKAFVHFDLWFNTEPAIKMHTEIESRKGKARLYYHEHHYWMLLPNDSNNIPSQPIQTIEQFDKEQQKVPQANMYPYYGLPIIQNGQPVMYNYGFPQMMVPMMNQQANGVQPNDQRSVYYSYYTQEDHNMEVEK